MAGRMHAGPMDFEYQNGTGPMDERSPFAQVGMHSQRNNQNHQNNTNSSNNNNNDKKRSFSMFGSPNKSTFPSLREPQSQPHFFSSPKPLPALPPSIRNNPLFSTPRKLDADDFASSGGETPKSPERGDIDSDATPEMNMRSKFSNLDTMTKPVFTAGGKKDKESPSRRQSWWRGLSNLASSPKSSSSTTTKDDYSHAAERRIMKRRSKEKHQQALVRQNSHSDSEQDTRQPSKTSRKPTSKHQKDLQPPPQPTDPNKPHWAFTFFDFITAHPTLPHILSYYAQLALNLFLISGIMYILYAFWSTIRGDIDKKAKEAAAVIMLEMGTCASNWNANGCDPSIRRPALEDLCNNWEKCMKQNPEALGRAKVSAHTFAEIFNGFIEPISYKAMLFVTVLIFGSIAISNFAFGIFRDKAAAHANAQHHHYYGNGNVPPTPQRAIGGVGGPGGDAVSGAAQDNQGYWTPYQQGQRMGLEQPAASGYDEGQRSPVRRLQFR